MDNVGRSHEIDIEVEAARQHLLNEIEKGEESLRKDGSITLSQLKERIADKL